MKKFLIIIICSLFSLPMFCEEHDLQALLHKLDDAIERIEDIDNKHRKAIEKSLRMFDEAVDDKIRYKLCLDLFSQYKKRNLDSMYIYAKEGWLLAKKMGDYEKMQNSMLNIADAYKKLARYDEALNVLQNMDRSYINTHGKRYYNMLHGVYFSLLKEGRSSEEQRGYRLMQRQYRDSMAIYETPNTMMYVCNQSMILRLNGQYNQAIKLFRNYESQHPDSIWNDASACAVASELYAASGHKDKSILFLAKAAILDKLAGNKSYTALQDLSRMLYEKGDIDHAYRYMMVCMNDIIQSKAKSRLTNVAGLLPIITAAHDKVVEEKRTTFVIYIITLISFLLVLVVMVLLILRRNRRLSVLRHELELKNIKLQENDVFIESKNKELALLNDQLQEENNIKEEYIAQLFNICSVYINDLENYRLSLLTKMKTHKTKELQTALESPVASKYKRELYRLFDSIFLKLFPNFIADFNDLITDGTTFLPKEGEILSPELRIYALVRLGITDSIRISSFLGYSKQTVYNYRQKVRTHIGVSREELVEKIKLL
nr:DUF6377 domain-containing protein [uncultured Prevotella sp.]